MSSIAEQTSLFDSPKLSSTSRHDFYPGEYVTLKQGAAALVLDVDDFSLVVRLADGVERTIPYWSVIEKCSCVPPNTPTLEPTHEHTLLPTHEHTSCCWVQTYYVTRRGKKHEYFRFCYLKDTKNIGSCVRVHIPGGNTESAIALARKQEVERAIARCIAPEVIEKLIRSWGRAIAHTTQNAR